jgi:hypothetical protein
MKDIFIELERHVLERKRSEFAKWALKWKTRQR